MVTKDGETKWIVKIFKVAHDTEKCIFFMKICPKCKQVNEDNARVCYKCGKRFTPPISQKKLMLFLLSIVAIAIIGGAGYGVWYFSQPKYYIYPEVNKISMDGDGETKEIKINTNAPYSEWEARTYSGWISITKKESSIIVECNDNNEDEIGNRIGWVDLRCLSGRNISEKSIKIEQGENTKTIRGEIKKVSTYYTNNSEDLTIEVKCHIRNLEEGSIRCAIWFYHEDDTKLIDTNREYCTSDGQVTVQDVDYDSYTNGHTFRLSIPISELHLSKSEEIRIDIGLFEYESDDDGRRFVHERNAKTFYVAM